MEVLDKIFSSYKTQVPSGYLPFHGVNPSDHLSPPAGLTAFHSWTGLSLTVSPPHKSRLVQKN